MIKYPASIDTSIELPTVVDNVTPINGALLNNIRDAVVSIESELGIKPSGIYANVRTRLNALEIGLTNLITIGGTFGGDLTGVTINSQRVVGLQGTPVGTLTPADGEVLTWSVGDNAWISAPTGATNSFTAGGDLAGTSTNQSVIKIRGASVPVAGSLTVGNGLHVTGISTLSYSALNLAGGANFVTGILPIANQASQTMSGDITGTTAASVVSKIHTIPVNATAPIDGYVLTYDGADGYWRPASTAGTFTAGGDLSGTGTSQNVIKIRGISVNATAPNDGQVLTYKVFPNDLEYQDQVANLAGDLSGTTASATVIKINGVSVPPGGTITVGTILRVTSGTSLGYGALDLSNPNAVTGSLPSGNQSSQTVGGDLSGTTASATVIKVRGNPVQSATYGGSQDGYVWTWVNGSNQVQMKPIPTQTATGSAGGDLSGTYPNPTVAKINATTISTAGGSLVTGKVLRVTGVSTADYGAVDLANVNAVTGILPIGNQASQTLAGDVTGTTASNTVVKINGTTVPATPSSNQVLVATSGTTSVWSQIFDGYVASSAAIAVSKLAAGTSAQVLLNNATPTPTWTTFAGDMTVGATGTTLVSKVNGASVSAAGSLTTGNGLYVSGSSALTYSALNLAGGINYVTGVLPTANQASQTMAGDVTGTTAANTVVKINGTSVPSAPSANQVLVATSGTTSAWSQIFDGYVAVSAAIAGTKISPNFGSQNILTSGTIGSGALTATSVRSSGLSTGVVHSDGSGNFTSSTIVNADVDTAAAIAGTKISPDFGSQVLQTTGLARFGPSAGSSASGFGISWPAPAVDTVFVYNAAGNSYYTNWSGSATGVGGFLAYNTSAGGSATIGMAIGGAGLSHATSAIAGNAFIEQAGSATSAIVFRKVLGNATSPGTTGRIYQSGAWVIGEAGQNDTSAEAQAGLTGSLINISDITGGVLTTVANQVLLYNNSGINTQQGHSGVRQIVGTTTILDTTSTGVVITGTFSAGAVTVSSFRDTALGTGIGHLDASGNLTSSLIVNADVNTSAAIAGTKISPDFGSQNVVTTGSITGSSFVGNSLDRAGAGALSIGITNATSVNIGGVSIPTTINGDLTVNGTTTTVNSTTVNIVDRIIHVNHSTGIVAVPSNITGISVHRGSTDGITDRDHAGLFWDETNSRFKLAFNTAGDDTTLGANLPLTASGATLSGMTTGRVVTTSTGGLLVDTAVLSVSNLPSLAGDVTGTITANTVVSLTGAAGVLPIASTGNIITWASATTAPGIAQTITSSGSGAFMRFTAQDTSNIGSTGGTMSVQSGNATGGSGTGGNVFLTSGGGITANGNVGFRTNINPTGLANNTTFFSFVNPNPNGTVSAQFTSTVTSPIITQGTITNASGVRFLLQAQSVGTDGYTGGELRLQAGDGYLVGTNSRGGDLTLKSGQTSTSTTGRDGYINFNLGQLGNFARWMNNNSSGVGVSQVALEFIKDNVTTPEIRIETSSTRVSATSLSIKAQSSTMAGSTGGQLLLTSGTGTTVAGSVVIQAGGVTRLTAAADGSVTIKEFLSIAPTGAGAVATDGYIRLAASTTAFSRSSTNTKNLQIFQTINDTYPEFGGNQEILMIGSDYNHTSNVIFDQIGIVSNNFSGFGTTNCGFLAFKNFTTLTADTNFKVGGGSMPNVPTHEFGDGYGVVRIGDALTVPTVNPSGGVILYSEAGVAKIRQPDGTIIPITTSGSIFTAGGDLTGTATSQQVVSLTGSGGIISIATTGNALTWNNATTSPKLKQADNTTNSATGQALTIQAQNATGTISTGGALVLLSGSGTSQDGYIQFVTGTSSTNLFNLYSQVVSPGTVLEFNAATPTSTGVAIRVAQSAVNTTGVPVQLNAQSTTAASSTGGNVNISAGFGTTANGQIRFRAQNTNGTFDTNITLKQTNSSVASIEFANTIAPTIINASSSVHDGYAFTIQAQAGTGGFAGGNLLLKAGTGTTVDGYVALQVGATTVAQATTSKFVSNRGARKNVTTITGTYTILITDENVIVTTNAAAFTITMPSTPTTGDWYTIKDGVGNVSTKNLTIAGNGKNIDGSSTYTMNINYAAITLVYNGTEWSIL